MLGEYGSKVCFDVLIRHLRQLSQDLRINIRVNEKLDMVYV